MLPDASAKRVLLEELVCSSMIFRNAAMSRALVREYDWISAFTWLFIRLILTNRSPSLRMTGPCGVYETVKGFRAMPLSVLTRTVIVRDRLGRESRNSSMLSTPLEVCIQPAVALNP